MRADKTDKNSTDSSTGTGDAELSEHDELSETKKLGGLSGLARRGRPSALVKTVSEPMTSYVYGLHAGDDKIVYVGVSTSTPASRLSVFRAPSSIASGKPNRRTSEWVQKHYSTAQAKVLAVLENSSTAERRKAQLEWIAKLDAEGHSLFNSEIAGFVDKRTRHDQSAALAKSVARLKPVKGEHLAVFTDSTTLRKIFGKITPDLVALVPKHVQWHIKFNRRDIDCVLCANESTAWITQATVFTTKAKQRERAAALANLNTSTTAPANVSRKTTVATSQDDAVQAQHAAATVAAISESDAAQSVTLVGVEAYQGTISELDLDTSSDNASDPILTVSSRTAVVDDSANPNYPALQESLNPSITIAELVSRGAVAPAPATLPAAVVPPAAVQIPVRMSMPVRPTAQQVTPQKSNREKALESALTDVLDQLKFLVEFVENELS